MLYVLLGLEKTETIASSEIGSSGIISSLKSNYNFQKRKQMKRKKNVEIICSL
jgi:hypothetical protein